MLYWEDYGGQSTEGFDFIGTDELRLPLDGSMSIDEMRSEIVRRCGRHARIKLFRKEEAADA